MLGKLLVSAELVFSPNAICLRYSLTTVTHPRRCTQCASVKYGSSCVAACPTGFQADTSNICGACSVECIDTCLAPSDPAQCTACKNYRDLGQCVSQCPTSKMFIDGSKNCLSACPLSYPYYNDTALTPGGAPSMPQMCVSSCLVLSTLHASNPSDSYRCSLPSQLAASTSSSSNNNGAIIAGVVVGLVLLVALCLFLLHRHRSRQAQVGQITGSPPPSQPRTPSRRSKADEFYFDPAGMEGAATHGNVAFADNMTTSFTQPYHATSPSYYPPSPSIHTLTGGHGAWGYSTDMDAFDQLTTESTKL